MKHGIRSLIDFQILCFQKSMNETSVQLPNIHEWHENNVGEQSTKN